MELLRRYVDGILQGTNSASSGKTLRNSYSKLTIGANWNYSTGSREVFFSGKMDEVRISNTARSADEIAEAYRAGRDHRISRTITSANLSTATKLPFYIASDRPGTFLEATVGESAYANYEPDANTVGLWHLEEKAGTGGLYKDSSGYGNHGTPTNSVPVKGIYGFARDFDGSQWYKTNYGDK